jgi:TRAP-type mannitol/chloroaromatic compound transport system permease small subunit
MRTENRTFATRAPERKSFGFPLLLLKGYIRFVDKLSEVIGRSAGVLLPVMVLVLSYEVVARYFFKRPTIWAYDMAIFMFGYCGLLVGGYVLREREHVNVDILYNRFSPRGKAIANSLSGILFIYLMVLIVVFTLDYGLKSFEIREATATEWGPPVWHFKLMLPIGAFLLFLQGLANWIRDLYHAFTGKEMDT